MITIEGQNNYAVKLDKSGKPIDGMFIVEGTSIITNTDVVIGGEILAITGLTTQVTDYALNHAASNGISGDLVLVEGRRSAVSDNAVSKLVGKGITVITEL